ncbi:MAG TPA: aspartyl protease family protein, partial [Candidatus Nitrosotalea sp.]|nr:aspartyl protease family protein [Candidatus Nitrosotalea sp.]
MLAILLAAAIAPSPQSATVPFTLVDNRMVVATSIDGQGPFSMIVDTGTTSVSVTPGVARRLRLGVQGGGSAIGAGSGSASYAVTHLSDLAVGSLHFADLHAEVIDLTRIQRAFGFPHLDGIIGYEVLHRLRFGVNMDRAQLTLSFQPIAVPKTATPVAFTVDEYGIPQIPAAVDGVHGTFVIDTGDRSSLTLFRRFAQANDFYRDAPVRDAITGIG